MKGKEKYLLNKSSSQSVPIGIYKFNAAVISENDTDPQCCKETVLSVI